MVRPYTVGKPFRFWCQKILPLVYDDSLSYYELLNKVVDYLNKVINNVNSIGEAFNDLTGQFENLQSSFNELQEMIDNYFDNLDVQQEINNKLDEMAEDGTLDALIQPLVDSAVSDAVSEWLEENVNPTGSAVVVDSSLTVSGAAADAKVTGDKISNLRSALNQQTTFADTIFEQGSVVYELTYTNNAMNSITGQQSDASNIRASTPGLYFIPIETELHISWDPTIHTFQIFCFSENKEYLGFVDKNNVTNNIVALKNGTRYMRFFMVNVDNSAITPEQAKSYATYTAIYTGRFADIENDTLSTILSGKKIAQFGDSIMAGDGASALGPGERLAQKYGITCLEYAIGGATMGYLDAQHSHIIDQVNLAITNEIEPDIILFNGGTNDMYGSPTPNCALGTISDVYTEPTASNEFSNGFESVAYKIKTTWPNAMVVFVRAHNMSSRPYDRQISYGEQGIAIADKWGFGVVDMYKRMNTQLPYYQQTYLSDATHPNAEGYARYYIPAIEQYLYEHRNELD